MVVAGFSLRLFAQPKGCGYQRSLLRSLKAAATMGLLRKSKNLRLPYLGELYYLQPQVSQPEDLGRCLLIPETFTLLVI